jgi:hypothetical protein
MAKKKYYAVKVGRKPEIYAPWFGKYGTETQVEGLLFDDSKSESSEKPGGSDKKTADNEVATQKRLLRDEAFEDD